MEREDVPVWNLLSDTSPNWKGAGSPPLSEEGKATQGDGMARTVSSQSAPGMERTGRTRQPFMFLPRGELKASGGFCLLPSARGWKCSFPLWSCLGDSPRLCLAGTC